MKTMKTNNSPLMKLFAATLKAANRSTHALWIASSLVALVFAWLASSGAAGAQPEIVWSTNFYGLGEPVKNVTFSSDGTWLASCVGRTASVWRVSDRSLVRAFSLSAGVLAAAISPDRTLLGAGNGIGGRAVWRIGDGTRLWSATGSESHDDYIIHSVAFSPDGRAFCYGQLRGISVVGSYGTQAFPFENPLDERGDERGVYDVRFSPEGTLLASANEDNTASLFRFPEGTLIRDLTGHSRPVMSVDFSPDGTLLATSAGDGTARLWNMTNDTPVRVIEGGGGTGVPVAGNEGVGRARFSADGKTLLTSSNGTLRFWRVSDGKLLLTYTNVGNGVFAVSPDGKHFAYGTGCGPGCSTPDTNHAVVLARMPLLITNADLRTNTFQMEWQGGTGVYNVAQRTNLSASEWETIAGPITNTNLSVPMTNKSSFFRVESLPTPP